MRRVNRVLWVLAILLLTSTASAQPGAGPDAGTAGGAPAPAPTPAEQAFADGRALLEANKFAEACNKFEESLRLDPSAPGTLLNLGLCNERLGKTASALGWFRRAQIRAAETGMTDYEDVAKDHTLSLAVRVPTVAITFEHPPQPPFFVTVDGKTIDEVDLGKLEIDPHQKHVIELHVNGKTTAHKEITLKDGDVDTVVLDAVEKKPVVTPPPPPKSTPPQIVEIDRGRTRRWIAYGVAASGLALWGVSLAVSLDAKHDAERSEHPEDWQHAQQVAFWGGTSLFVAGTLALGAAGYLYFTAPGVERVEGNVVVNARPQTAIIPAVGPNGIGLVVHGGF